MAPSDPLDDDLLLAYNFLRPSHYYLYFALQIISATLSLLGSMKILQLVWQQRKRRFEVYHRLMVAMSLSDILLDISVLLLFPLMRADFQRPLAIGNIATCTAVGFFSTFAFCTVNIYFVALSVYFLLTIRLRKKERQVEKMFEPYCHIFAIGLPLVLCISAVSLEGFNPTKIIPTCFMRPLPSNCLFDENVPCQRGGKALVIFAIVIILSFVFLVAGIVCTWLVYLTLRKQQQKNLRHTFEGSRNSAMESYRRRIGLVSRQAIWYTCIFLVGLTASFFSSCVEILYSRGLENAVTARNPSTNTGLAVALGFYFFVCPLHGLFNLITFIHPSYAAWRKVSSGKPAIWALSQAIRGVVPPTNACGVPVRPLPVDGNINDEDLAIQDGTHAGEDPSDGTMGTDDNSASMYY